MAEQQGITVKKLENFSEWYTQVIQKADLIEYSDVSGCYILKPYSYALWETLQAHFDKKIKSIGVKNAYFPLLIPEALLTKESKHIEGFIPEVAWVTQTGLSPLNERLAIRPTSETIMYAAYSKWIRSHRDLPVRLNQWCNVLRWEFKHPVPFLRSREFLWQEGHTAFATKEEADKEVLDILELYREVFEDLFAVPMFKGQKSEKEKFAGAAYTMSVETFLPIGKAIQGATSHSLGQNFAKPFEIAFLDEKEKKQYVWQNSWGLSTRSIGIMIISHGDDKGLVMPPRVAPIQAVIVPIILKKGKKDVLKKVQSLSKKLKNIRLEIDDREEFTPGWKYNYWEMKGVPLRIEIGPRDVEKDQVVLVRRDTGEKEFVKTKEIQKRIDELLEEIQSNLLRKARKFMEENLVEAKNITQFKKAINNKKMVKSLWCGSEDCEEQVRDKSGGAKSLNFPFHEKETKGKCFLCGTKAEKYAYFAKSY